MDKANNKRKSKFNIKNNELVNETGSSSESENFNSLIKNQNINNDLKHCTSNDNTNNTNNKILNPETLPVGLMATMVINQIKNVIDK